MEAKSQADQDEAKRRRLAARAEESQLLSWKDDEVDESRGKKASRVLLLSPCWTGEHAEQYNESSAFYEAVEFLVESQLKLIGCAYKCVRALRRHPLGVVCLKMASTNEAQGLVDFVTQRDVCLSPLKALPDQADTHTYKLQFYDGMTDLEALCLKDASTCFEGKHDLDAYDRLWFMVSKHTEQNVGAKIR